MDEFDKRLKHEMVPAGNSNHPEVEPDFTVIEVPSPNNEMVRQIVQKRLDFAAELIKKQNPNKNCQVTVDPEAIAFLNRLYNGSLSFILTMTSNIIAYATEIEGRTFPLTIDAALAERGFNDVKQSLTYDPNKGESPGKLRHFVAVM